MTRKIFNPLEYPVCLDFPVWLETTAWAEHVPFAMYLIGAARPETLVELGTYHGVSYFAFCQAVRALSLNTKCYAVDTWEGDEHAGQIEQSILPRLQTHNDLHYADFSRLVRATFDEAQKNFDDGSIDLLHIDGFHTYEAVRHDFETWRPKMSDGGIVLFHDVNVREKDFGVWKFWGEISREHRHFTFLHGHGLGVLAVGAKVPEELEHLFEAGEKETAAIRNFFHQYGARIDAMREFNAQKEYIKYLQTHENIVRKSYLMRAYRVFKHEGVGSLLKKARNKGDES
ncbi:MAG: class I SAM-dependent methyltransferase [Pyrinomonadaceae bacterium]